LDTKLHKQTPQDSSLLWHQIHYTMHTLLSTLLLYFHYTTPLFYTLLLLYYAATPILYNNTNKTNVICQIVIECKVHNMIRTLCITCRTEHAQHAEMYINFSFSNRKMKSYTTLLLSVMSESRLAHNESYPQQWRQFW